MVQDDPGDFRFQQNLRAQLAGGAGKAQVELNGVHVAVLRTEGGADQVFRQTSLHPGSLRSVDDLDLQSRFPLAVHETLHDLQFFGRLDQDHAAFPVVFDVMVQLFPQALEDSALAEPVPDDSGFLIGKMAVHRNRKPRRRGPSIR